MKTKSKLVLGLSILSAATLAAGVTSTFAWYQASVGATGTNGFASDLTSNTNVTGVSATVALTFTEVDAAGKKSNEGGYAIRSTKLQQVAVDRTGSVGSYSYSTVHKYWNGAENISYAGEATLFDFAVYEIKATISDSGQATDFIGSGKDLIITIAVDDAVTGQAADDDDRLLGWVAGSRQTAITVEEAYAAQTDQTANEVRFVTAGTENWGTGEVIGYLAVFFHGADGLDSSALTGNVYVHVADAVKLP